VLLVEDDTIIRLTTADMLVNFGHSVANAADAAQAFQLLDKHTFDVMITDIALPGLAGDELAARAIGQQPGLRIIFASGYETPKAGRPRELMDPVQLQKPYNEQRLADALKAPVSTSKPDLEVETR
jgi:CheY-like chemotaxis protein